MGKIVNITSGSNTAGLNLGTLTLGTVTGASGMAPWNVKSLLEDSIFTNSSRIKKYEVIETPEDLLAMSVAWHRIRKENKEATGSKPYPTITTLLSNDLFGFITQEDRDKANVIRDYYSKKIMMLTLLEVRLSPFRQDLKDYLHGDCKKFTEKVVPMIYRLPEFHEFDVLFENVKRHMAPTTAYNMREFLDSGCRGESVELYPVAVLKKESRRLKIFEYWMRSESEKAYCISINHDNPLKSLWDREFSKQRIHFRTDLLPHVRDGLFYYQLKNYHVA
jgi:hypothetical protein